MNSIKLNYVLALNLILLSCGCAFLASSRTQRGLEIASRRATFEYVRRHPETRPVFHASAVFLEYTFTNAVTAKDFVDAFQSLRVREFKGDDGALLLRDALDILDITILEQARENNLPGLKATALSVAKGISEGLNLIPPLPVEPTVNTNSP